MCREPSNGLVRGLQVRRLCYRMYISERLSQRKLSIAASGSAKRVTKEVKEVALYCLCSLCE